MRSNSAHSHSALSSPVEDSLARLYASHPEANIPTAMNAWEQARNLSDEETGIILGVQENRSPASSNFGLCSYQARLAHIEYHSGIKFRSGSGIGLTREEALGRAIGEALETYSATLNWHTTETVRGTSSVLSKNALDPSQMCLLTEAEAKIPLPYNLQLYDPNKPMLWKWGICLNTGIPILIPASMVNQPYLENEISLWEPNTSGWSCGTSYESAILAGLMEIIERDALMISWLNRIPCPRITLDPFLKDNRIATLADRIQRHNLELIVNEISLDIRIPVFAAWLVDRSGRLPAAILGTAANPDPYEACYKAILEACQSHTYCAHILKQYLPDWPGFGSNYEKVVTFEDHMLLFSRPDMLEKLDFMLKAPPIESDFLQEEPIICPTMGIVSCLERLQQAGLTAYVVDLSTSEAARCGFFVVKVLISGTQQITSLGAVRMLNNKRLYQVPKKLGYSLTETRPDSLQYLPHPLP